MHIECLLEEPSAEALLLGLLPRILPVGTTFRTLVFQGKPDLLAKLPQRLRAYRAWIPDDYRILVLVDGDLDDCRLLKARMEAAAAVAGLVTRTAAHGGPFRVLNRLAIEELEAWFFGDPEALASAYPGVSPHLGKHASYRDPDAIRGGTHEALSRVLNRAGYHRGGLAKIELARTMAGHMDPARNVSPSFRQFVRGLAEL